MAQLAAMVLSNLRVHSLKPGQGGNVLSWVEDWGIGDPYTCLLTQLKGKNCSIICVRLEVLPMLNLTYFTCEIKRLLVNFFRMEKTVTEMSAGWLGLIKSVHICMLITKISWKIEKVKFLNDRC